MRVGLAFLAAVAVFPHFRPLVEDRGFRDLHAHSVNLYVKRAALALIG